MLYFNNNLQFADDDVTSKLGLFRFVRLTETKSCYDNTLILIIECLSD